MVKYLNFHNSSFALRYFFNVNGKAMVWHNPWIHLTISWIISSIKEFRHVNTFNEGPWLINGHYQMPNCASLSYANVLDLRCTWKKYSLVPSIGTSYQLVSCFSFTRNFLSSKSEI
jgi:hypothetical protein